MLAASAVPMVARACDPEEINALLNAVCTAALRQAAEATASVRGIANAIENATLAEALARARDECAGGNPDAAASLAVRIARLAGRIEGRAGVADPVILSAR
jgi:hypothetical protein